MKRPLVILLALMAVVSIALLAACSAVSDESETDDLLLTETQAETQTETQTETELQPSVNSLEELVDVYFKIDCHEDAEWEEKLLPSGYEGKPIVNVYQGKVHENGKRMVYLVLEPVSEDETERLIALADQFQLNADGSAERVIPSLCRKALIRHFRSHVSLPSDVLYDLTMLEMLLLYATEAEIEQYAKCSCVSVMIDGEEFYRSFTTPNTNN